TGAAPLRPGDGRPRYDGVAGFLASRGIELPRGDPDDPPDRETVCGLGNAKDRYFVAHLREHGAEPFPTSVAFVRGLRERGLRTAVVSASRNMVAVLESAGLRELFDAEVDGVEAARLGLPGKPDPALFLEAARRLGITPDRAAVVEDALAGVEAGRRGRLPGGGGGGRGRPGAGLAAAAAWGWWWVGPGGAGPRPWPSGAPTWSWPTWASWPWRAGRPGRSAHEPLGAGLRRLRPAHRGAAGGAVRPRQRLPGHPRGRARGGRRRRPLPRHLHRRLLQPPGQPGRRPRGGERGPGQHAQLAARDRPAP